MTVLWCVSRKELLVWTATREGMIDRERACIHVSDTTRYRGINVTAEPIDETNIKSVTSVSSHSRTSLSASRARDAGLALFGLGFRRRSGAPDSGPASASAEEAREAVEDLSSLQIVPLLQAFLWRDGDGADERR